MAESPVSLDLSALVDGYNWLLEHEWQFTMNRWIGQLAHNVTDETDQDKRYEAVLRTNTQPECGTVFCLCGAALLVDAQSRGMPELIIPFGPEAVVQTFIGVLERNNPEWDGSWWEVSKSLSYLFMGEYFSEEYDVDIENVTLELAREGIEWVCSKWGHTPVFVE